MIVCFTTSIWGTQQLLLCSTLTAELPLQIKAIEEKYARLETELERRRQATHDAVREFIEKEISEALAAVQQQRLDAENGGGQRDQVRGQLYRVIIRVNATFPLTLVIKCRSTNQSKARQWR